MGARALLSPQWGAVGGPTGGTSEHGWPLGATPKLLRGVEVARCKGECWLFKALLHPKFTFSQRDEEPSQEEGEAPCPSMCTKFSSEQSKCRAESGDC